MVLRESRRRIGKEKRKRRRRGAVLLSSRQGFKYDRCHGFDGFFAIQTIACDDDIVRKIILLFDEILIQLEPIHNLRLDAFTLSATSATSIDYTF